MLDRHAQPPRSPAPTPELVLAAYAQGLFPMARSRHSRLVDWYSPDPRAVIPLDAFRPPRSVRQRIRRADLAVTRDAAFDRVIRACAEPRPDHPDTWINPDILHAYCALHRRGHAHSVETWLGNPGESSDAQLVGGLYGVTIGGAFFGESMFSRPDLGGTDASKIALAHLVDHLRARGFVLLDSQINSPHMRSLGAVDVPRAEYLRMLKHALAVEAKWA